MILGEAHARPEAPKIDTVECPMCGIRHLAGSGYRFTPLPTVTISKFVFNRIDDRAHDAVIYTWLNRDATLRRIEGELTKTQIQLSETRRENATLHTKLSSVTEQRNLYRALVRNLDPNYDDDE